MLKASRSAVQAFDRGVRALPSIEKKGPTATNPSHCSTSQSESRRDSIQDSASFWINQKPRASRLDVLRRSDVLIICACCCRLQKVVNGGLTSERKISNLEKFAQNTAARPVSNEDPDQPPQYNRAQSSSRTQTCGFAQS